MGVDSGIFAKNAKKYLWFDRAKNLQGWRYSDAFDVESKESERAEVIHEAMYRPDSRKSHVSAEEALFLAGVSKKAWLLDNDKSERPRSTWCQSVIDFIKLYPNDVFSLKSDHGDEWPDCCNKYEEIKL